MFTGLIGALLALLYTALSLRVIKLRKRLSIAIGDGGDASLQRAIRAHANFIEYVPLTLILLYCLEQIIPHCFCIKTFGTSLLLGRLLHAFAISRLNEKIYLRVSGMALTFFAMIGTAVMLIVHSVIL